VTATITPQALERIQERSTVAENQLLRKVIEGVLEMADFKPSDHKFRLIPLFGSPLVCTFNEEMSGAVQELIRSVARVSGLAEVDSHGKIRSFQVEHIARRGSPFSGDFSEHKTIAQLIREQKVKPIKSISELHGIWPEHEPKPN
jgi:hypothetical protein